MAVSFFSQGTRTNLSRSGYFLPGVGPTSHTLEKEKEKEKRKKVEEKVKEAESTHQSKNTLGT